MFKFSSNFSIGVLFRETKIIEDGITNNSNLKNFLYINNKNIP